MFLVFFVFFVFFGFFGFWGQDTEGKVRLHKHSALESLRDLVQAQLDFHD